MLCIALHRRMHTFQDRESGAGCLRDSVSALPNGHNGRIKVKLILWMSSAKLRLPI